MKIIVLAGGLSTERDVSLSSGSGICRTLREKGHEAFLLDPFLGLPDAPENLEDVFTLPDAGLSIAAGIKSTEPDLDAIKASRKDKSDCFLGANVIELCRLADIVFMGLHGDVGENGKLQATFDILGIRYTGPGSLGCALSMDKEITKVIFEANNIPTPKGTWLKRTEKDHSLSSLGLNLPLVVKPCSGGSSIGVYFAYTEEEFDKAVQESFRYEDEIIIEEYIKGRELACGVIDGKALPVIEICPKNGWFDYANKYQAGLTEEICPARIPEDIALRIQKASEQAFRALKLDVYARADFLLTDNGDIYCLEYNSLPGMTSASLLPKEALAAGIEYGDLCELIIEKSLDARYRG
nr:D-alanine--D-alanine ligase [uncultured Sellimonas sp.]